MIHDGIGEGEPWDHAKLALDRDAFVKWQTSRRRKRGSDYFRMQRDQDVPLGAALLNVVDRRIWADY